MIDVNDEPISSKNSESLIREEDNGEKETSVKIDKGNDATENESVNDEEERKGEGKTQVKKEKVIGCIDKGNEATESESVNDEEERKGEGQTQVKKEKATQSELVNDEEERKEEGKTQVKKEKVIGCFGNSKLIEGLLICPPKEIVKDNDESKFVVELPLLRDDEPVSSIRGALSELVVYAHLTQYRLVIEKSNEKVSEGAMEEEEIILDDFLDLSRYVKYFEEGRKRILVQVTTYDAASVKDHVSRLRSLLDGNPPNLETLVEEEQRRESSKEIKKEKKYDSVDPAQLLKEMSEKMPEYTADIPITKNYDNLEYFYDLSCGELCDDKKNNELETYIDQMQKYDKICDVPCFIKYSGYHPPTRQRQILCNDLAYLEVIVSLSSSDLVIYITSIPTGFYVNRSTSSSFDPRPATNHFYSHSLLECLLDSTKGFKVLWAKALEASKQRAVLTCSKNDSPLYALYHIMKRAYISKDSNHLSLVDSIVLKPSWVVPPLDTLCNSASYNLHRTEADLSDTHGVEIRSPGVRFWNEEFQSAREMPITTPEERMDRARVIHKILSDFGDAVLAGVKAINNGYIIAMNPSESNKSHVYLHNNIFFSRAVDAAAVDTFKVARGDKAARKGASRDANCSGLLHRLDVVRKGIYTLATVIVDYLGVRYVCQSVIPGILHGEKTHELLYGAIEVTSPIVTDETFHTLMRETIGETSMIASRPIPTFPFCDDIYEMKSDFNQTIKTEDRKEFPKTRIMSGPIEAKGICGADKRNYVLDVPRLTPRDANWVTKEDGGTGNWELVQTQDDKKSKKNLFIPKILFDDEWTMAVLRPELISQLQEKGQNERPPNLEAQSNGNNSPSSVSHVESSPIKKNYYNVNVFLPYIKSFKNVLSPEEYQIYLEDEQKVRDASDYLWNNLLPQLTKEIKDNALLESCNSTTSATIPVDGLSLKKILHSRGINIRYLGRLAQLAQNEEKKDGELEKKDRETKYKKQNLLQRKIMPYSWLELLECEMIARAAKHVLDSYFMVQENIFSPAQIIASFLSALVSTSEETAADTEHRLKKQTTKAVTDDEMNSMTFGYQMTTKVFRGRAAVWKDIESEIGRRFRYTLTLYSNKNSRRALYLPLLRRVCQRIGVRIASRYYKLGSKSRCSLAYTSPSSSSSTVSGLLTASYPISPLDIIDIVPLIKHSGASQGFVPCSFNSSAVCSASLNILLSDALVAHEAANTHWKARSLSKALDNAQDAASLYQRVVDSPLHVNIAQCLDLTAVILFQAQEFELAAANASRALALVVQLGGFDCAEAIAAHTTLAHILVTSTDLAGGVKHLRAALYLMELMAGPQYSDIPGIYHKIGTIYHEVGNVQQALRMYEEASCRNPSDRILQTMIYKSLALALAALGFFKVALENEKRAYTIYRSMFGDEHELTINSANNLKHFTKLAVEKGSRLIAEQKKQIVRQKEAEAKAIASKIQDEEEKKIQQQTAVTNKENKDDEKNMKSRSKKKKRSKKKN